MEETQNLIKISINGVEIKIQDTELRQIVEQMISQIAANNQTFSQHINNLNDRLSLIESSIETNKADIAELTTIVEENEQDTAAALYDLDERKVDK